MLTQKQKMDQVTQLQTKFDQLQERFDKLEKENDLLKRSVINKELRMAEYYDHGYHKNTEIYNDEWLDIMTEALEFLSGEGFISDLTIEDYKEWIDYDQHMKDSDDSDDSDDE
tara:strand:+ start:183 stop:521 length:339 start_codon:yes stop_codon:yes gene_type:complete